MACQLHAFLSAFLVAMTAAASASLTVPARHVAPHRARGPGLVEVGAKVNVLKRRWPHRRKGRHNMRGFDKRPGSVKRGIGWMPRRLRHPLRDARLSVLPEDQVEKDRKNTALLAKQSAAQKAVIRQEELEIDNGWIKRPTSEVGFPRQDSGSASSPSAKRISMLGQSTKWDKSVPWVPAFVPFIGIGNVTEPTIAPPPPPTLDDNLSLQPLDTQIGHYVLGVFGGGPTATPPPNQAALDLAYGCPSQDLPGQYYVLADKNCGGQRHGKWVTTGGDLILSWQEVNDPSGKADVVFKTPPPYNEVFAYTKTVSAAEDATIDSIDIFDCGDNHLYTISEKLYRKETGGEATFFTWDITSSSGDHLGKTGYVPMAANGGADDFVLADPGGGGDVASLNRKGIWSPTAQCPVEDMKWEIHAGDGNQLGGKGKRWVVAVFTTVLSLRDQDRDANGFALPSKASMWSEAQLILWYVARFIVIVAIFVVIYMYVLDRLAWAMLWVERNVMPSMSNKPSRFDP